MSVSFGSRPSDAKANAKTLATPSKSNKGDHLTMPQVVNLAESGLRHSPRLQEQQKKKAEEGHPKIGKNKSVFSTKQILGLFTILSTICAAATSNHIQLHENATRYEKLVNRFHEANE